MASSSCGPSPRRRSRISGLRGAGIDLFPFYSLIPWVGVMAAGYALGPVMRWPAERRQRWLAAAGLAMIVGFVLLRASNLYGDPAPWAVQDGALATLLAFVNCEKYPPSALYLAMTLGPALVVLALFGDRRAGPANVVVTFGRVPFLFYIAHLFVVHAVAVVVASAFFGDAAWLFGVCRSSRSPRAADSVCPACTRSGWRCSPRSIRSAGGSPPSSNVAGTGGSATCKPVIGVTREARSVFPLSSREKTMAIVTRRTFIKAALATSGSLALPAIIAAESERPQLTSGIQIGDVTGDRAIVWSRADRPSRLIVERSSHEDFREAVRVRGPLALDTSDYTARVDLTGLPPAPPSPSPRAISRRPALRRCSHSNG
jgi:PhoD-like phosphatase, N-terminal domain